MTAPMLAGSDPDFEEGDNPPEKADQEASKAPAAGELLTLPPMAAAAKAIKLFVDQRKRPDVDRMICQGEVNRLRREGYTLVEVRKTANQNRFTVHQSPISEVVPGWNKADDLCDKWVNILLSDDPAPECVPSSGEMEDVEAAEFAERALRYLQGDGQLDEPTAYWRALDLCCTYGRTYIRYWVDPQGERGPEQMLAHPQALSADQPFLIPAPPILGPMGPVPPVDPMTGQPVMVQGPPPYVLRYVTAQRQLVDDAEQANKIWLPKLRLEVLKEKQVRMLPATAQDVWAADGVCIGTFRSVAELRSLFPDVIGAMDEAALVKLTDYKPERDKRDLWPEGAPEQQDDLPLDDRQVFTVTVLYKACPAYPEGCTLMAAGKDTLLERMPWVGPKGETLDLPVTEVVQFWRGRDKPVALMELLGPANEQRGAMIGHLLQYLDDFANRAVFVSAYGMLKAEDLEYRNRKYLPYQPGHQPVNEDIPDFPSAGHVFFELAGKEMDTAANLQQAAQGLEDSDVKSGAHAREIRSAAQTLLSGPQKHLAKAYVRGCRIQLQLVRAFYTQPQEIGWVGEDGQYRQRSWVGSDLGSVKDVRLKKGTLTMLSKQAKVQDAIYYSQVGMNPKTGQPGLVTAPELREMLADNLGGDLSLRDNAHRLRVRRQIADFLEGPPEGWMPPPPVPVQMGVDPAGQPIMGMQPGVDPLWAPLAVDVVPEVAARRFEELSKTMAGLKYQRQPPEWRAGFDAECERMRLAAGIQTMQEIAAAQAAQAQQQAEQAAAKEAPSPSSR